METFRWWWGDIWEILEWYFGQKSPNYWPNVIQIVPKCRPKTTKFHPDITQILSTYHLEIFPNSALISKNYHPNITQISTIYHQILPKYCPNTTKISCKYHANIPHLYFNSLPWCPQRQWWSYNYTGNFKINTYKTSWDWAGAQPGWDS